MTTGEGDLKPAAPTLKELAKELKRSFYYDEEGEHTGVQALYSENVWGVACQLEAFTESAPPAAERTALKILRSKIEAIMPNAEPRGVIFRKSEVLAIIDSEIDAASASEGTNTP